jgi:signal transduction histidine kinase
MRLALCLGPRMECGIGQGGLMETDIETTADAKATRRARASSADLNQATPDLDHATRFQAYLQRISELEKSTLVRELHDDLGGLLVGATMDLAWAEQNWDVKSEEARAKCARARQSLATAIDLKRKLGEKLRPSLLENVGLFAALRWQIKGICSEAGFKCHVDLPETELRLSPEAAIMLFRIVQETFARFHITSKGAVDLAVCTDEENFEIRMGATDSTRLASGSKEPDYPLMAIKQRMSLFGGHTTMLYPTAFSMKFTASVPMRHILRGPQLVT